MATTPRTDSPAVEIPTQLEIARFVRDIRTAADAPTHRFPNLEKLYDELYPEDGPKTEPTPMGVVLAFPGTR